MREDLDPRKLECASSQIVFNFMKVIFEMWYVPLMKKKYPDISEKWDPYLTYKPHKSDCSDMH